MLWLSGCLARTAKVLCSNFGATRHGMTLEKSLTAVCLGSPGRCILITCNIRWPLRLVSVYEDPKWLSGGTLFQVCLLSRATTSNSCRKNIGLSKLFPASTLYRKVAEKRGILSFFSPTISTHSLFLFSIRISNLKRYFKFLEVFSWNEPVFSNHTERVLFVSHMNGYLFFAQTAAPMWKSETNNVLQELL